MKGILLLSHGDMAKGMLQSSSIFFGENLPQVQALGYQMTDDSEAFEERIGKAIAELDSGDGVLVLTDLFAGTPALFKARAGRCDLRSEPAFVFRTAGFAGSWRPGSEYADADWKRWNPAVGSRSAAERRRFLLNSNDYDKIEDL